MSDKKQKPKISAEAIQEQMKDTTVSFSDATAKMGSKLRQLLKREIEEYKQREKTRGAEMLSIFAAHNFYSNGFSPLELRTTLEDLGPTYVKIGQIMSSRPDLLPESYCKELEKLRQNVKPLSATVVRAVIEDETGKKIEDIYSEFRDEPLGSASIGQAHYGVLKDGTPVVTKVQRPLIADMMVKDFVFLKKLASLVSSVSDNDEDEQIVDLASVIDELEKVSMQELDFRTEARNTTFFKENCIEDEEVISCPSVIEELTTQRIFTMTFVDGCSVAHTDRLIQEGCDLNAIGTAIVNNYVHQILDVGTFHADPHQGNIMVSHGKPYWIDFGMLGTITPKESEQIQALLLAFINAESENLVNVIMSMGSASPKTDRDKLTQDVDAFLTSLNGVTSIDEVDISALLNEVSEISSRNHCKMPGSFTMLVRSVIAVEGVIEQLCPELNLMDIVSAHLLERAKKSFDLKKTLMEAGKGLLGIGKKTAALPGLAADALAGLAKGKTKINMELTGLDEPLERIGVFTKHIVLAIIACVLFIGACILSSVDLQPKTSTGMPLLSAVIMTFSVALGIYAVKNMGKKG